jgi:alpha-L-fucosidase
MTLNDSWGFHAADDAWKSPKQVIRNLIECSSQGGNYLLNIGPRADGSIPEESVKIFHEVGQWMQRNGDTIYASDLCQPRHSEFASFTRKGNTLFMHVYFWPGETVALGGLKTKIRSARLHASGTPVKFEQERFRTRFTGLPASAPDHPVTTIAIECEDVPVQDTSMIRKERPRRGVGV